MSMGIHLNIFLFLASCNLDSRRADCQPSSFAAATTGVADSHSPWNRSSHPECIYILRTVCHKFKKMICHDWRSFIDKAYFYLAIVSNEHELPNLMILANLVPWCRPSPTKAKARTIYIFWLPSTHTLPLPSRRTPQFCKINERIWWCMLEDAKMLAAKWQGRGLAGW